MMERNGRGYLARRRLRWFSYGTEHHQPLASFWRQRPIPSPVLNSALLLAWLYEVQCRELHYYRVQNISFHTGADEMHKRPPGLMIILFVEHLTKMSLQGIVQTSLLCLLEEQRRSEERRVGKECPV